MTQSINLYRHFDSGGALLYVGVSLSAVGRLASHQRQSGWAPDIARVEIETLPDRASALRAEKEAIANESPQFNIMHQAKRPLVANDTSGGKTLVEKIQLSRLPLKDLAKLAEVDYQTMRRWGLGQDPRANQLPALARALDLTTSDLLPDCD